MYVGHKLVTKSRFLEDYLVDVTTQQIHKGMTCQVCLVKLCDLLS